MKKLLLFAVVILSFTACQDDEETSTSSNSTGTPAPVDPYLSYINFTKDGQSLTFTTANELYEASVGGNLSIDDIYCADYSASVYRSDLNDLQPSLIIANNCTPANNVSYEWFQTLFSTGAQEFTSDETTPGWIFRIYTPQDETTLTTENVIQPTSSQITITNIEELTIFGIPYIYVTGTFQCDVQSGTGGNITNGSFRLGFEQFQ
jgi:hypothetical protein